MLRRRIEGVRGGDFSFHSFCLICDFLICSGWDFLTVLIYGYWIYFSSRLLHQDDLCTFRIYFVYCSGYLLDCIGGLSVLSGSNGMVVPNGASDRLEITEITELLGKCLEAPSLGRIFRLSQSISSSRPQPSCER